MSEFVNTVDIVGDEALTNSIVDRSITEIKDNTLNTIGPYAFAYCKALTLADFPAVTKISSRAFFSATNFAALVLRAETRATLVNTDALLYNSAERYIYVPAALVDSYKTATNWSYYETKFRALEDYTVDGTITGELDETKI